VKSFGGTLDITSAPGSGCSIVATFPLSPPNGAATAPAEAAAQAV
jgi:hypothetical protein